MKIKKKYVFILFFCVLGVYGDFHISNTSAQVSNPIFLNLGFGGMTEADIEEVNNATIVMPYDPSKVMDGFNMFSRRSTNDLYFMDLDGKIIASKKEAGDPKLVNATTVLYLARIGPNRVAHLWNLKTNVTESFANFSAGHHDLEYNPVTDTFLVFNSINYGTYNGTDIGYDDIAEYSRNGTELWYWNCSEYIPFNETWYLNETARGNVDWTHANAIFWDIDEDIVYYNPRNLDTIYKIDKSTGNILWKIGKWGDYTLYDKYGNEADSLWYHSHSLEKIGPNRFMIFDNDLWNTSREDPLVGYSRLIEIEVDEVSKVARELWSWVSPSEYYSDKWGDADRLPNGNTLGVIGDDVYSPPHITEVSPEGEIVWELMLNDSIGGEWGIYRAERVLKEPWLVINDINPIIDLAVDTDKIEFSIWDTYRSRYTIESGIIRVLKGMDLIYEKKFSFLPHWQETLVYLNVTEITEELNLIQGTHMLNITIENAAGQQTSQNLLLRIKKSMPTYLVAMITGFSSVGIAGILVTIKISTSKTRELQ